MICKRCKGKKKVKIYESLECVALEKCYKCDGTGYTDWITLIFSENQTKTKDAKNSESFYFDYVTLQPKEKIDNINVIVNNGEEYPSSSYLKAKDYERVL